MRNSLLNDKPEHISHAVREQLLMLDGELCIQGASKSFYNAFKFEPEQTIGKALADLGTGQWNIPTLLALLRGLPTTDGEFDDLEMEADFPAMGHRSMQISARRLSGDDPKGGMILLSIRDTTGQKRTEKEVGELLSRFRTILASIGDAVIVTDLDSRITFMNPTAERLTGWIQSDAMQKRLTNVFNIVNEQSLRSVENPVTKAIRDGAIVGLANHTVLIARDGTEWPIDDSAAPIFDAAGQITGVVLVFHDITNRRNAEHELEVSEIRYRRLFETAHDGILILDATTAKVLDVNHFMMDLLGYGREHFMGKELWEIGFFQDAECSKAAMITLQNLGSIRYDDLPLKHMDGRHIAVEFVSNVYQEGRLNVIQCNIRDITERKIAAGVDSHLAAIVASSDDAIISKTLDGIISSWNPGAERMFGYTAADIVGRPVALLYPMDRLDEEVKILNQLRNGHRVDHFQTVRAAKDGRLIEVSLTVSPVRDRAGRIIGASKILRDITSSKRAEVALSKAKEAAEAANRSKSEFLANMSHEIRTPMSAILGFADMLLNDHEDETGRVECVQIIQRNALHLLELINEILDLSKIEALQMKVERVDCNLPELFSEVIALMQPRALEKGLRFGVTFEGPIPRIVKTDPMRLRQIVINLLGNAVKFTQEGSIDILISDRGAGTESIELHIDVIDSGIGMTKEQLARLFQPFTQGDESITRKFGGTGLGLTISRRLAELLNGDIIVTSELGIGSKFSLRIDGGSSATVEALNGLTEAELPSLTAGAVHQNVTLSGRILLVEDGHDNQRLFRMQLGDAGAIVVSAADGRIAVDLASNQAFDLILMDMQMPVMDGYAATAELRRMGIKTPIIALTALAMAEDRAKCIAIGCDDYVSKPVKEELLLKTVNRHIGHESSPESVVAVPSVIEPHPPSQMTVPSATIKSSLADNPRMRTIIPEFVEGLSREVAKMREMLMQKDLPALRRIVHQLRGASGGYGFDAVTEPAIRAEESIKVGNAIESITADINLLIEVIRRIDGYVESTLPVEPTVASRAAGNV